MIYPDRKSLHRALEDLEPPVTFTEIGKSCGVSASIVSKTAHVENCPTRTIKHARVEMAIADALGVDVFDVFPDHNPPQPLLQAQEARA